MILAAIDIGSNAARLLINEVKKQPGKKEEFTKLNLLRVPLRLGMDVFKNGEIGPERQAMFIKTMNIFKDLMDIYKVEHYRACATSAMRDAKNGNDLIEIVQETTNINIEIISGDEEAGIIYENHIAESMDKDFAYLYIDVGGGSTELTFYEKGKMKFKKSYNIGTIRLLNNLVEKKQWENLMNEVKSKIKSDQPILAIGSGGNINKVFSLSKTKEGKAMTLSYLKKMHKEISKLSVAERMEQLNIREDRADVLAPALEIYTQVLHWADISKIYVPKISVADGLIHQLYEKNK
ncbi:MULTISPECIES: exopolyphosphatase [Amniculibacterium]|uniref:Ppx/GppA phosphatase family protein n=1 Tax=Amniculibacterium TaxID=2715289 RepID=UPI000F5B4717|nr:MULTISPECIES: exopolyphosphatase [Amniculibacterium]